jgi:hypothetical protein
MYTHKQRPRTVAGFSRWFWWLPRLINVGSIVSKQSYFYHHGTHKERVMKNKNACMRVWESPALQAWDYFLERESQVVEEEARKNITISHQKPRSKLSVWCHLQCTCVPVKGTCSHFKNGDWLVWLARQAWPWNSKLPCFLDSALFGPPGP